jgi:hypothetical protein
VFNHDTKHKRNKISFVIKINIDVTSIKRTTTNVQKNANFIVSYVVCKYIKVQRMPVLI